MRNFIESLITFRRLEETALLLLAHSQDIRSPESIGSRLLVAAQALSRPKEETIRQALDHVSP